MRNHTILTIDIIAVAFFLALANIAQKLSGFAQIKHLTIIFVLFLFTAVSLWSAYQGNESGWNGLLFLFVLSIVELFVLYFQQRFHFLGFVVLAALGLAGFFVVALKEKSVTEETEEEIKVPVLEPEEKEVLNVEEIVPEHSVVYKSHQPGKYIASKSGSPKENC